MKLWIVHGSTQYGSGAAVVAAPDPATALKLVQAHCEGDGLTWWTPTRIIGTTRGKARVVDLWSHIE